ncbi:PTS sugar transporter subunit IIA [Tetragenococcus solitarius]|uniref:PTS sugar transporter subunit IIA n=1 Tax=Tetragenococcus solitarius TaxID=71453 RepID=A0ABN3XZM3_9ENTE|nr:PTS sugar transporter subunit IIA [Tetragenococcus solitarius]
MTKAQFRIIITTHSSLCNGYLDAAALILNSKCENVELLTFKENMSTEDFEKSLVEMIDVHPTQPLLILTDLVGGTPANIAIKYMKKAAIEIVSGINLPLLLEVLMKQEAGEQLKDIQFKEVIKNSQESIIYVNELLRGGTVND